MKRFLLATVFLLSVVFSQAQDTFSIVAVDPATGEVGAAGASCVEGAGNFGGVKLISGLIPGRGGINAQAWVCIPNVNLDNAISRMQQGFAPQEIISWLQTHDACNARNYDPRFRQYGIVDLAADGSARAAAFTGSLADDYKGHLTGVNYSIQGNILIGPEVLTRMEQAFQETEGSLADKLMAAMQGAKIPGADARCLSRGTTSTSAFLRVARPNDQPNALYLDLNAAEVSFGQESIDALQALFDQQFPTIIPSPAATAELLKAYPNPAENLLKIELQDHRIVQIRVFNSLGQLVLHQTVAPSPTAELDLSRIGSGIFLLQIKDGDHRSFSVKFSKF